MKTQLLTATLILASGALCAQNTDRLSGGVTTHRNRAQVPTASAIRLERTSPTSVSDNAVFQVHADKKTEVEILVLNAQNDVIRREKRTFPAGDTEVRIPTYEIANGRHCVYVQAGRAFDKADFVVTK